ncbi:hypothetical protein MAC_09794 [Metarhizium acridum CQMa 102]|uniref:Uncharacterized protein n=1 Tax=Metarhizium acridum (strain CQMa 102) TaxID=655827 RepID=E9EIU6_METAQ|nr:uncharacterized protein MAC_09794 [Metarhizium acridum CQMa 102]EFY84162.1 hypothetical protein MAC_09794 [Metarhizium acridum CQMa 102]
MRFIQAAALAFGLLDLAIAQNWPNQCFCPGVYCNNDSPQCTPDGANATLTLCCASGQIAFNGKCVSRGSQLCSDGETICSGPESQCAVDTNGKSICCARGQVAVHGKCVAPGSNPCSDGKTVCSGTKSQCAVDASGKSKCVEPGSNACSDGKTVCSGAKSQCTVNVTVFGDGSGGALSNPICCAPGEKAINGRCFPGKAKVMPCYRGVCDWGQGEYSAWNEGNADSRCCKLNEYYKGNSCVRKP